MADDLFKDLFGDLAKEANKGQEGGKANGQESPSQDQPKDGRKEVRADDSSGGKKASSDSSKEGVKSGAKTKRKGSASGGQIKGVSKGQKSRQEDHVEDPVRAPIDPLELEMVGSLDELVTSSEYFALADELMEIQEIVEQEIPGFESACPVCQLDPKQRLHLESRLWEAGGSLTHKKISQKDLKKHWHYHLPYQPPPLKKFYRRDVMMRYSLLTPRQKTLIELIWRGRYLTTNTIALLLYAPPGQIGERHLWAARQDLNFLARHHFIYRYKPSKRRWEDKLGSSAWALGRAGAMVIEDGNVKVLRDQFAISQEDVRTLSLPHDLTSAWLYAIARDQLHLSRAAWRGWQGLLSFNYLNWHAARDTRLGYWDAAHFVRRDQIPDGLGTIGWHVPAGEAWLLSQDPKRLGRILPKTSGVNLGTVPGAIGDKDMPRLSFLFPWFLEYDRGGKKAWEVADQVMAYTHLERAGTVGKLLPEVGGMIPVFFVFRSREKLGTVRKILKKRMGELKARGIIQAPTPIFMTTEMLWSTHLAEGRICIHAWEDRPALTLAEVLFEHANLIMENPKLLHTHILELDTKAAKLGGQQGRQTLPPRRPEVDFGEDGEEL